MDKASQGQRSHGYLHQSKGDPYLSIDALLFVRLVEQYELVEEGPDLFELSALLPVLLSALQLLAYLHYLLNSGCAESAAGEV